MRQHGRIEAHRVFNDKNHLHAHIQDVAVGVHLVLEKLDDSQQQVHVAQP